MSDPNGVNNSQSASPAQQNMIPKERFDELIANQRRLEQENLTLQQVLRSQVPPQQQAQPAQEDPRLKKLREENPEFYALTVSAIQKAREANATSFMNWDKLDRIEFKQNYGEEATQRLQEVEALLQQYRSAGHSNVTREQIYTHIKGVDSLKTPKAKVEVPVAPPTQQASNVPSSDPALAGTSAGGSATSQSGSRSLEQLEKDLENHIL